jgi:hypothetical protein
MRYLNSLSVALVSVGLVAGSAIAQTTEQAATEENPNAEIVRQIENETGSGAAELKPNTMGEAAATAQTDQPIGSGAAIEWVGKPLAAVDGTKVGTVSEVLVDENGAVTAVKAKVGGIFGFFAREVSIPASRIIVERDGMVVAELSAEEITSAPRASG